MGPALYEIDLNDQRLKCLVIFVSEAKDLQNLLSSNWENELAQFDFAILLSCWQTLFLSSSSSLVVDKEKLQSLLEKFTPICTFHLNPIHLSLIHLPKSFRTKQKRIKFATEKQSDLDSNMLSLHANLFALKLFLLNQNKEEKLRALSLSLFAIIIVSKVDFALLKSKFHYFRPTRIAWTSSTHAWWSLLGELRSSLYFPSLT